MIPDPMDYSTDRISIILNTKKDEWPNLVRMWRQFHGCPATFARVERLFFKAGKQHDDLRKSTTDVTIAKYLVKIKY